MAASVNSFIEEMGLIFQDSGGPRIAGRIFALLLAEGHEMSLHQISDRLQVSRASVSTNARQLAQQGVIKLTTHAGDRQDYYRMVDLPFSDIIGQMAERFRRNAQTIGACVEPMAAEDSAAAGRVADLQKFYEKSAELLVDWARVLRDANTTTGAKT